MGMLPPKKKGFLAYGKEEDPEDVADGGADEETEGEGPSDAGEMRLQHLAEQTGVEDPKALIKLIKACMSAG